MSKNIKDVNVFDLSKIQDKPATMYHNEGVTYMYIGADKYIIPEGEMALMVEGAVDKWEDKLKGFKFKEDVKLDGMIAVLQMDANYLVAFATPIFSTVNAHVPGAINDVVVLKIGNALEDLEAVSDLYKD